MRTLSIPISTLLICLFATASQAGTPAGRLAFGLDMPFLRYNGTTVETENEEVSVETDVFQIGLAGQPVGLWGGFTVIDHLTVGMRLTLAFNNSEQTTSTENFLGIEGSASNEQKNFQLLLFPFAEYAFDLGMFSPFATAGLGLGHNRVESGNETITNTQFLLGGGGGVHIFLLDGLSLDASLLLSGGFGGGESEVESGGNSQSTDLDSRTFQLQVLVGISGWI